MHLISVNGVVIPEGNQPDCLALGGENLRVSEYGLQEKMEVGVSYFRFADTELSPVLRQIAATGVC